MTPEVARRIRRQGFWMDMTEPRGGWDGPERRIIRMIKRQIDGENLWRRLFG